MKKCLVFFLFCLRGYASIPTPLEPEYLEAVLALHENLPKKTLLILTSLLKQEPQSIEFLELKALDYKALNDHEGTLRTYDALVKIQTQANAPPKKLAPYFFELGALYFNKKNIPKAQEYFRKSIQSKYNLGASYLYFGMIHFNDLQWSKAAHYFKKTVASNAMDLRPMAEYYLGQCYQRSGYPLFATISFMGAQSKASTILNSTGFSQTTMDQVHEVYQNVKKIITPLDRAYFSGSVATLLQYDSNVLLIPSLAKGNPQTSGKSTLKSLLQASVDYHTSLVKPLYFASGYDFIGNYNYNRLSRQGEFAINHLGLDVSNSPFSRLNFGLRSDGYWVFRTDFDAAKNTGVMRQFLLLAEIAEHTKYQIYPGIFSGFEFGLRPQKFLQDSPQDDFRRSGTAFFAKVFIQKQQEEQYLNPTFSVGYELNRTKGKEYRSKSIPFVLSNEFIFREKNRMGFKLGYEYSFFPERVGGLRKDHNIILDLELRRAINTKFFILGNTGWTRNISNLSNIYTYSRFIFGLGIRYNL